MLQFLSLVLLLCAIVHADISGTDPPTGTCLCFDGDAAINVRDAGCGAVIGTANSRTCFVYTGQGETCSLSGVTFDYFRIDWFNQDGWSAGVHLTTASDSNCTANSGVFTDACLNCICVAQSNCNQEIGCVGTTCGPFQISEQYWGDCGSPGTDFMSCANDMACSETCVRAYMDRYGTYCTEGRPPTCEDYARIHFGGPTGCTCSCTDVYWEEVMTCCGGQTGCDTSII